MCSIQAQILNIPQDTIAGPPDGETSDELVTKRLGLGDGAESTGGHLLSIQLDGALGEVEPLLDDAGELSDPPALLSEDILGPGGHDDDLGPGGGHSDLQVSLITTW